MALPINNPDELITHLYSIRNLYGKQFSQEKIQLLNSVSIKTIKNKTVLQSLYAVLLFLLAYPDNKIIYKQSSQLLQQLQQYIQANEKLRFRLYNTGITGTSVCAAFSFEIVKWLRKTRPTEIKLSSVEADDAQIQSILSVVMSKTESEIFQDANAEWKGWLKQQRKPEENLLDQFISIFDSSNIRPEVKGELWNTIGINVEINFTSHCTLPGSLVKPYHHRSIIRKEVKQPVQKLIGVKLTKNEAEQIIDCSRMVLLRNLREIDPISFTEVNLVSYYHLPRGISVALMGMVAARRHPVDSYMGYMVFKNGLPVAYAGSWILFDSGRIGLNVFYEYRGGESKYIFDMVLQLHAKVYHLKRFTVDPYQIGKENSDGIHSGAFWIYYNAGFRPLKNEQKAMAVAESLKVKANRKYRSSSSVLKRLADSRQEFVLQKNAVGFDATDLSRAYVAILTTKYKGNRLLAEKDAEKKLAGILQIKNYQDDNIKFILKNWAVLLLGNEKELRHNSPLKNVLKKLFVLKANGDEEAYIKLLQQSNDLRKYLEWILKKYSIPEN